MERQAVDSLRHVVPLQQGQRMGGRAQLERGRQPVLQVEVAIGCPRGVDRARPAPRSPHHAAQRARGDQSHRRRPGRTERLKTGKEQEGGSGQSSARESEQGGAGHAREPHDPP
jgi:hypothetical protein